MCQEATKRVLCHKAYFLFPNQSNILNTNPNVLPLTETADPDLDPDSAPPSSDQRAMTAFSETPENSGIRLKPDILCRQAAMAFTSAVPKPGFCTATATSVSSTRSYSVSNKVPLLQNQCFPKLNWQIHANATAHAP
ncbi:hypothetical protein D770_11615 [Flammeovirgaceae bacterium 311]|nr:hypothetical protein D770_11615 [Flammeovirgaceae bacterium 311]